MNTSTKTERNFGSNYCQTISNSVQIQWGRLIACLPQLDSIDLIEPSLSLGRSDECDIVIHKSKFPPNQIFFVSKKHFLITKDLEDTFIAYLTDLSKNGTFVNNHQIGRNKTVILQNDDFISIGDRQIIYTFKSVGYAVDSSYLPDGLKHKYVPSCILGKGACGEVRLTYNKFTCKKFAIKKIIKGRNTASQVHKINHPNRINTEISILQKLSHPLIVGMEELWETEQEMFIVLEYLQGGELSSLISSKCLSESNVKFLFYQMVLAVEYLHSKGITHRDLKPGNVLLLTSDPYCLVKLTDFGLSNLSEDYDMMKTICGTWHFIAPEVLNPNVSKYSHQVDVWSLGVILYYMLSNTLPFNSNERCVLEKLILFGKYTMDNASWYEISTDAKDLIKQMLIVDPDNRITVDGILNHRWIKEDSLMQFKVQRLIASVQNNIGDENKRKNNFDDGNRKKRICHPDG